MNKYLISADIEGITGVMSKEFTGAGGLYYTAGCRYMAHDVNAVVEGILAADPEAEILVRDAHGAMATNLSLELLHPRASLIQGWDAVQNMLTGLDETYRAVFAVGYHAGGQDLDAVLSHTMHSLIAEVRVNGQVFNETGLFALYAGYFNVPLVFISGDDHAVNEARQQLGEHICGVAVKRSYGRICAQSLSLEAAATKLRIEAQQAVQQCAQSMPLKLTAPLTMTIKFYDNGVRKSTYRYLSQLLATDHTYQFDVAQHEVSFTGEHALMLMQRLSVLLFILYGIGR